jgi:hypothetical protein
VQFIISAGSATFFNQRGVASGAGGGELFFYDALTAATATITNEAGLVNGASGGLTWFPSGMATASDQLLPQREP